MESLTLGVRGMTCASCGSRVEHALGKVDGVVAASVNLATERANITFLPGLASPAELASAVRKAGYEVRSRKAITNIRQNLFWAFFYNTLLIPVAAGSVGASVRLFAPELRKENRWTSNSRR